MPARIRRQNKAASAENLLQGAIKTRMSSSFRAASGF
jgi:hypothetical protein